MQLALNSSTGINSVAQFFTVLLIFVGVLCLTYFTTKWVAGYQKGRMMAGNIQLIESFRISNNKFLAIVKVGEKCFLVAVAKDNISLIGEVNEDELVISENSGQMMNMNFKEILEKAKLKKK
ncbi:MAG: flagellar biosynthetic protein FliO [Lachnospiraceae bacterium]|nr:flagellar biosynthetic protein FliO [Lachnospiraceae bacterium]